MNNSAGEKKKKIEFTEKQLRYRNKKQPTFTENDEILI